MSEHSARLDAERLLKLSEQVSRIAADLARMSKESEDHPLVLDKEAVSEAPELSAGAVNRVIRARRLRARYFSPDLFSDPAWDMLLALLHAEILQRRVQVSRLSESAGVPATTALRWVKVLVDEGLVIRRPDPVDLRRVYVELSPETGRALRRYFAGIEIRS